MGLLNNLYKFLALVHLGRFDVVNLAKKPKNVPLKSSNSFSYFLILMLTYRVLFIEIYIQIRNILRKNQGEHK
jgi:hypothetical protein